MVLTVLVVLLCIAITLMFSLTVVGSLVRRWEDLPEFVSEENFRRDVRFRVARRVPSWVLKEAGRFSGAVSGILFWVTVFVGLSTAIDSSQKPKTTAFFLKENGQVQKVEMTVAEENNLLMAEEVPTHEIERVRASEVLYLGGGVYRVCGSRTSDKIARCGSVTRHVSAGETIYLRSGSLIKWRSGDANHRTTDRWAISEQEAKNLVASGFKIID